MNNDKKETPTQIFNGAKKEATLAFGSFKAFQTAAFEAAKSAAKGTATNIAKRALASALKGLTPEDVDLIAEKADGPRDALVAFRDLVKDWTVYEDGVWTFSTSKTAPSKKAREGMGWLKNASGRVNHKKAENLSAVCDAQVKAVEEKGEKKDEKKEKKAADKSVVLSGIAFGKVA